MSAELVVSEELDLRFAVKVAKNQVMYNTAGPAPATTREIRSRQASGARSDNKTIVKTLCAVDRRRRPYICVTVAVRHLRMAKITMNPLR